MIDPQNPNYSDTPISQERPVFNYRPADPNESPAATIVTPFHNTGPVFHETAQSILQQSLQQWEWLIINDGSDDPQSLSILNEYRHCDSRIRVIDHETRKGPSAAKNTGFRAATTEFILPLDSDDLIEPTTIEKFRWFLESHPEWSFVNGYSIGFGEREYLWHKGFHNGNECLEENLIDNTCLTRKSVHEAIGGFDESIRDGMEDWDYWIRSAHLGYWGFTIPEFFKWYRRRKEHSDHW